MNTVMKMDDNMERDSVNTIDYTAEEKMSIYKHNLSYKTRMCPECGKVLLEEDKYCYNCGIKLPKIRKAIPSTNISRENRSLFRRLNQKSITELKDQYNKNLNINESSHTLLHYDLTINYLINLESKYRNDCLWNQYRHLFLEESALYSKINDKEKELETSLKFFISTINPWRDKKVAFDEEYINSEESEKLVELLKNQKIRFNRLSELYIHVYNELRLPSEIIPIEDSFKYLLKLIDGRSPVEINKEISERITVDKTKNYTFSNKNQENVIAKELENCFR